MHHVSQMSDRCQTQCIEVLRILTENPYRHRYCCPLQLIWTPRRAKGIQDSFGRKLMKHLITVSVVSAAVFLFGCGGAPIPPSSSGTPSSGTPSTGPPSTVTDNWQFSAASTVPGKPPLTFAGSVTQTGVSGVSGALHVGGSNCFNQMTTMGLTGTETASNVSLSSAAVNGQVVTLGGTFTGTGFTGTYSVSGGCDGGDQGTVTGVIVDDTDADAWDATFTSSAQTTFSAQGNFAQSGVANSDGSFGITGTATFNTPCFSTATISPGSLPSGNFILGTLVSLQIQTNNGTLTILGTEVPGEFDIWHLHRCRRHLRSNRHSSRGLNWSVGLSLSRVLRTGLTRAFNCLHQDASCNFFDQPRLRLWRSREVGWKRDTACYRKRSLNGRSRDKHNEPTSRDSTRGPGRKGLLNAQFGFAPDRA